MKTFLLLMTFLGLCLIGNANAESDKGAIFAVKDPDRTIGINIGDVLIRNVSIEADLNQKIDAKSLPRKGARVDGVELVDINVSSSKQKERIFHTVTLSYQVFGDSNTPKVMKLPAEVIELSGGKRFDIPAWSFWFSPLVNTTFNNVLPNVQPQIKAQLLDRTHHALLLSMFATILLTGLVGIIYVNAEKPWLPFMGGAFSKAYRINKKLAGAKMQDRAMVKTALFNLHNAFNETYGKNLFIHDVENFIQLHPGYKNLTSEIVSFFEKSNQALFSGNDISKMQLFSNLLTFSRNLRDCERGL